jgi:hypothetical protein
VALVGGRVPRLLAKGYRGGFDLPSAGWDGASARFNTGSGGFFYTFRHGNVIFLSLGIPDLEGCDLGNGRTWTREWAARQEEALRDYLASLRGEIEKTDVWLVVYLHDHHAIIDDGGKYPELFLRYGVDLALAGHQHFFRHRTVWNGPADYRAVVAGSRGVRRHGPGRRLQAPRLCMAEVQAMCSGTGKRQHRSATRRGKRGAGTPWRPRSVLMPDHENRLRQDFCVSTEG